MRLIPLTQGQCAKVDDQDYLDLSANKWCLKKDLKTGTMYAKRGQKNKLIVNAP